MNEDNIKKVPNLYNTPENPVKGDCYYNISDNNYYIYDGTDWLVPEIEELGYIYQIQYSQNGGQTFTTQTYDSYDALTAAVPNLESVSGSTDIAFIVGNIPDPRAAVLRPANGDQHAYLLLNGEIVGEIYPKVIFNNICIEDINISFN